MAVACPLCSYPTDGRHHKRLCRTTVYQASPATVANFEGREVLLGESWPSPPSSWPGVIREGGGAWPELHRHPPIPGFHLDAFGEDYPIPIFEGDPFVVAVSE